MAAKRAANKHIFVSVKGEALPRWLEAFPDAVLRRFDGQSPIPDGVKLVWIRLDNEKPPSEQIERLGAWLGTVPFVVLSDIPSDNQSLEVFGLGAKGYCNAHATATNLRQVSQSVLSGGLWIGASLMQRLVRATAVIPAVAAEVKLTQDQEVALKSLTERENEVARQVAVGYSNKEVARTLGITERTVKAHVGSVLDKLHVRDRLQLALLFNRRKGG
jgi:DNA-binding NarL/FixJ family response regulator